MSIRGFRAEPVAVERGIRAAIYAAVAFGLVQWTDAKAEAVVTLMLVAVVPVVEFIGGVFLRSQVLSEHTARKAGTSIAKVHEIAGIRGAVLVPDYTLTRLTERPPRG